MWRLAMANRALIATDRLPGPRILEEASAGAPPEGFITV